MGMIDDFVEATRRRMSLPSPEMKNLEELRRDGVPGASDANCDRLAGYTLGEADLLRRAMGKKKPEEMALQRVKFVEAQRQWASPRKIEKIFDLMENSRLWVPKRIRRHTRTWRHYPISNALSTNSCRRC